MYFDQIHANLWILKNAQEEYRVSYGDQADAQLINELNILINDPNRLSLAKDKARVFLKRLSPAQPDNSTGSRKSVKAKQSIEFAEVIDMFNTIQQAETNEEDLLIFLKGTTLRVKKYTIPFIIKDPEDDQVTINVAAKFQQFQQYSIDLCTENGLLLETHPFNILALSSVLLLKKNNYPADLLSYFSLEELELTHDAILKRLIEEDYEDILFNPNLKSKVYKIIKTYLKRTRSKIECIKDLTNLLEKHSDVNIEIENNILISLINYVQILPNTKPANKLLEIELCVTNLNPLVYNIFSLGSSSLRWANQITEESKASPEAVNQRRRPDAVISALEQNAYTYSKGFGEVKSEEAKKNAYSLTRDLVRLGIFSKQSIDHDEMNANINFQAIGPSVKFYLQSLIKDGIYPLVEFAEVKVPMAKDDLPRFVDQFDTLRLISRAYQRCTNQPSAHKRQTFDSPAFKRYVNDKCSRHSHTQLTFD